MERSTTACVPITTGIECSLLCVFLMHSFHSCTLTNSGTCDDKDLKFTFVGQVGLVTALANDLAIPQVWITFNGGRTSYQFSQQDVKLETASKSMYGK